MNDSSEAWCCVMCDDTVKGDLIKRQLCLKWAHYVCVGVGNMLEYVCDLCNR